MQAVSCKLQAARLKIDTELLVPAFLISEPQRLMGYCYAIAIFTTNFFTGVGAPTSTSG